MKEQDYKITTSEEYKTYIKALCRLSSSYVSWIRVKFAEQAYDMYQNETVRKLVLEYAKEIAKLDDHRLRDFELATRRDDLRADSLEDWCLNRAGHYSETIKFFFGIY